MQNNISTSNTVSNTNTTSRRRRLAQIAGTAIVATAALTTLGTTAHADGGGTGVGRVGGKMHLEDVSFGLSCESGYLGGVHVAVADLNGDGSVDDADYLTWQRGFGGGAADDWFVADSFSFGVEREFGELDQKGDSTAGDLRVGELQECTISRYGDAGEQTYLAVELENVQITSYQLGVLDAADTDHDKWSDIVIFAQTTHADYNGDGLVDADDFAVWQDNATADKEHDKWIIIQSMSSPIFRSIPEG